MPGMTDLIAIFIGEGPVDTNRLGIYRFIWVPARPVSGYRTISHGFGAQKVLGLAMPKFPVED